ncbi:MAG: tRNA (adenosine(37)-N6)-dimethylallyltransferase MiaA [Bacteroidaceae bacterium]|nr:tRNA (adenosine(37)-N6)-dimethylallyltransferase MiaA [Bacteroidaceae bacterium]
MAKYDMITVLGPTASGKTRLAVALAARIGGEILSADSRQVYRGMDIGTGKDLADYCIGGRKIPYHLIDIAQAGTKYNVYEFQSDFRKAYADVTGRGKFPIMCGGTGLYLESVLNGYRLIPVPENPELRRSLEGKSLAELTHILEGYKTLHNTTDVDTAKRAIRAIEIEECYRSTPVSASEFPKIDSLVIGVDIERELRRQRISERLEARLQEGMIDEVKSLLDSGIPADDLIYYGLEYKYVTLYVTGQLPYKYLLQELEVAIHQFAKRQMTWFRGMERRGIHIEWIPYDMDMDSKVNCIVELMNKGTDD